MFIALEQSGSKTVEIFRIKNALNSAKEVLKNRQSLTATSILHKFGHFIPLATSTTLLPRIRTAERNTLNRL